MCLDDQILNTYVDGELEEPWKSQVEEHLSYCNSCRNRCNSLRDLSRRIKDAQLSSEEIETRKERVLSVLEKNHLNKKKSSFMSKRFKFSVPQIFGVAAAFVIVFAGSWTLMERKSSNVIPVPEIGYSIDVSNITPVRATDNAASSRSLETYTLDEILKNLDARGYDVDVRLKSIQPVNFEEVGEEKVVLAYADGTTVTSDGVARDAQGNILATGLRVEGTTVMTSDGSVVFSELEVLAN